MSESLEQEIRTLRSLFWSERDPEGRAFAPLADACLRAGETREALELLTDGLGRHPDFTSGHVVAAKLYLGQGMLGEAELSARRVLELDGENVLALESLAQVLAQSGDADEAQRIEATLAELDPERVGAPLVADPGSAADAAYGEEGEAFVGAPTNDLLDLPEGPFPGDLDLALSGFEVGPTEDELGWSAEDDASAGAFDVRPDADAIVDLGPAPAAYEPGDAAERGDIDLPAADTGAEFDLASLDGISVAPPDGADATELELDAELEPEADVMGFDSLALEAEAEADVMSLDALAPDPEPEAEAEVMSLDALAPDPEPEAEAEVMSLDALAPDPEPEVEAEVMSLDALAPDPEPEVMSLDALAPDPEPEVMSLDALAPDPEPDAVSLDALAPDPDEPTRSSGTDEQAAAAEPSVPVQTRTLAELYVKQGFADKALEVLRQLQQRHPGATDLAQRIQELESGDFEGPHRPSVPGPALPSRHGSGRSHSTETAMLAGDDDDGDAGDEMEELARGMTESAAEHDVDTPFTWTESEADAPRRPSREGPRIGDYFDGLLAWEERERP